MAMRVAARGSVAGMLLFLGLFGVTRASAQAPRIVLDEDRRVSARVQAAPLREVLQAFSDATGVEVRTSGRADETVSVDFERLPEYEALKTILAGRSSIGFYASDESGSEGAPPRLAEVWILDGSARSARSGPKPPTRKRQVRWPRSDPVEPVKAQAPSDKGTAQATATVMARPRRPEFAASPPNVVIYTSRGCGSCKRALAYLDSKGIPYVHRNITTDPEARKEFRAKGGGGVPLIEVGGESMRGFNAPRLDQLLARGG